MLTKESGPALSETGQDYARRIGKSAQFMDAMLIDMLAFSRINQQRLELAPVSLDTVIPVILSRLEQDIQEKNARVQAPGPWPSVLAHEPLLAQALVNLFCGALLDDLFKLPGPVCKLNLGLAQRFLCAFAFGNVAGDFGRADELTRVIFDGRDRHRNIDPGAVPALEHGFVMFEGLSVVATFEHARLLSRTFRRREHRNRLAASERSRLPCSFLKPARSFE